MRHSGVPGRGACHLRGMVGNDHPLEVIAMKDRENTEHVYIAFVDERFTIAGYFADHVAQMNVGNSALSAVLVHRIVDIALGHLSQRAYAKLKRIAATWSQVNQALIHLWLIN